MNYALLFSVFGAGMLASINPCGFAMLPAYISFFLNLEKSTTTHSGSSETESQPGNIGQTTAVRAAPSLSKALIIGATTTAGFLVLFLSVGIIISLGASILVNAIPWIGLVIGGILVFLGIWLLSGKHLTIPVLTSVKFEKSRNLKSFFLFGTAYGLASLTCTLPLFLAVVGSVFTAGGILPAVAQFIAYAIGMGVVLIALTLSLAFFKGAMVKRVRRLVPYVERVSAVLMLGAGAYIVYYWLFTGGLYYQILAV